MLKTLEHPNVLWLHEIIDDPNKGDLLLVTRYYENGSLGNQVRNLCRNGVFRGLEPWQARFYLCDVLLQNTFFTNAIRSVVGVIHKDIKPDNIVIGDNREAVLIDFGVSAMYNPRDAATAELKLKVGTYNFFAPELLDHNKT